MRKSTKQLALAAICVGCVGLAAGSAPAAIWTNSSSSDSYWSTGGNWDTSVKPTSTTDVNLGGTGYTDPGTVGSPVISSTLTVDASARFLTFDTAGWNITALTPTTMFLYLYSDAASPNNKYVINSNGAGFNTIDVRVNMTSPSGTKVAQLNTQTGNTLRLTRGFRPASTGQIFLQGGGNVLIEDVENLDNDIRRMSVRQGTTYILNATKMGQVGQSVYVDATDSNSRMAGVGTQRVSTGAAQNPITDSTFAAGTVLAPGGHNIGGTWYGSEFGTLTFSPRPNPNWTWAGSMSWRQGPQSNFDGGVALLPQSKLDIRVGGTVGENTKLHIEGGTQFYAAGSGSNPSPLDQTIRSLGFLDLKGTPIWSTDPTPVLLGFSDGPTLSLTGPVAPAIGTYVVATFDYLKPKYTGGFLSGAVSMGEFFDVLYNGLPLSSVSGTVTYHYGQSSYPLSNPVANQFDYSGYQPGKGWIEVTFIPEPGALGLVGLGLFGAMARRRRSR